MKATRNVTQNGAGTTSFDVVGTKKNTPIRIKGTVTNQFAATGRWLKGNLHNHLDRPGKTDWKNGAVGAYRRAGYDFIAGMDHDKIVAVQGGPDLVVVPGAEISCGGHLLAYGIDAIPPVATQGSRADTIADMVRKVKDAGGVAVLAHPFKSGYTYAELARIADAGLDGIEVINANVRGKGADSGHADQLWHMLLRDGFDLLALGNDDAHGPHESLDQLGEGFAPQTAWTGLLASVYSHQGIMEALRRKRTYASQGPELFDVEMVEDGKLCVRCSPCAACHVRSPGTEYGGASCYPPEGQRTSESFQFDFAVNGYRVQDAVTIVLEDAGRRRAYTSPIRVSIEYEAI